MATKINELKVTINKVQRTAGFFYQHFPTTSMLKNATGWIDSRIGISGEASDVIKDGIDKLGGLLDKAKLEDTLCDVLIP